MVRRWSVKTRVVSLAFVSLALGACDPYVRFVGDSNAGAVDPVNFPAEYLGTNGDGKKPGMGVLTASVASVADQAVGYYLFPYTAPDLSLSIQGELLAPVDYQFDEDGGSRCVAPESYVFDQQRDAVRYDEQGNIFTTLPDASGQLTSMEPIGAVVTSLARYTGTGVCAGERWAAAALRQVFDR